MSPLPTDPPAANSRHASQPVGTNSSAPVADTRPRSARPQSVRMPSPPVYRTTSPNSRGSKPTTPTGTDAQGGHSPPAGPLSPGSNPGSSSFIFPIRSVFQGMTPSDSTQSSMYSPESDRKYTLSRGPSGSIRRTKQHPTVADPNRRESISADHPGAHNVVGISTIAQMLEESHLMSQNKDKDMGPATATFTSTKQGSRPPTTGGQVVEQSKGFFSAPLDKGEDETPFFGDVRRASEPLDVSPDDKSFPTPYRPDLPHKDDSADTVQQAIPKNDSADAPGSGLTNPRRPPVGQPQQKATGVNYTDRPGETTGDKQKYHQSGVDTPRPAHPPSSDKQPTSQQPVLRAPKPQRAPGTNDSLSSTGSRRRSNHTNLELDEQGRQALVTDYSGIIRLADVGDLSSHTNTGASRTGTGETGTGAGSRSKDPQSQSSQRSAASGPTGPRLAHNSRHSGRSDARDTVQSFINQQAHTTNLLDPNAPTPSPTPHDFGEQSDNAGTVPRQGRGQSQGQSQDHQWSGRSETSLDTRDSSEVATASASVYEEDESDEEDPIVTFRFEHVATDDGHHVVVGREGKLQRCEDEPITTPGAVQGFGVLIVLEEDYDSGRMTVRQVSENSTELLGLSPRYLFRLDCFSRVFTDEQEEILRDNIEFLPDTESGKGSVQDEGPQVFLISGFGEPGSNDDEDEDESASQSAGRRREWSCWVAAHRPKQPTWNKVNADGKPIDPPDLIVLEFELERDVYNPLMQAFDSRACSDTPDSASNTTVSASHGLGTHSSGSGQQDSEESTTTVGSTPRPPLAQAGSSDSGTAIGSRGLTSGSAGTALVSQRSSKLRSGDRPMGLEGIEMDVPLERIIESTTNHAKPLRALERMRRGNNADNDSGSGSGTGSSSRRRRRPTRRFANHGTGTMDVFAIMGQMNDQLGSAPDLESFLKVCVGVMQDLCRFHRVLIYQFDESYNGQVVAEIVEWGKTTDLYRGLMFPAADIPAQARNLYMSNKVRLLYDRSQTTARMVLRSKEDLDHPLDMTHCYLRAMSPIHIKYLANMNVRSSMSVSIMAFGQLWGLIACHSYGQHGMRVSFPVRQMIRVVSDSISRNIERLSYAQRLHTRKLISTIPSQHHPTGYIVSNADDLLQIFDADTGLLVIGDGCKLLGDHLEQGTSMLAIAEFLRIMKFDQIRASNHLSRDFPDLVLPRAQDTIAGLLYVPLTAKAGQDFIVFLRKGQVREVQWAGKPYKDEQSDQKASLEPRKSFKTWSETVIGRSRSWSDDQLESAGVLALIYGKFIQVWREKQTAMASNQLTAILLSNTSHAVRTPLSQIINTLELALSGDIDDDTRSMLENSHQASRALLFHVHDLLDLTRIETGHETGFNDPFDIQRAINDALRLYQTEAERRGIDFRVNMAADLPKHVVGDYRKIKTVISNLVANAVKFTEEGHIEVYCGLQTSEAQGNQVARAGHVPIEVVIADTGCGIPNDKLEQMFLLLEGAEAKPAENQIGLGLAVVARIVEQLSGQLRVDSEVGVGTKFFFTLQMRLHDPNSDNDLTGSLVRQRTRQSTGSDSVKSMRSKSTSSSVAAKSEIDTFVQDFSSSHMMAPVAADDQRLIDAEKRMNRPGTFPVTDSSYPVKPSRMDTETESSTSPPLQSPAMPTSPRLTSPKQHSRITFGRGLSFPSKAPASPAASAASEFKRLSMSSAEGSSSGRSKRGSKGEQKLRVLVVEDDMINSQILKKRLKMDKHTAIAVTNGQEAVTHLKGDRDIDLILMDIQMPIMDGRTAAQEIRKLERETPQPADIDPLRIDGRIPIVAVSASLYESDRTNLSENFDGWLLKPLDFNRVRILLKGLEDDQIRHQEVYKQGNWEKGGFLRDGRNPSPLSLDITE